MQQATLSPIPSPSVSLVKGRPATTSLEVAKFFGKRHDDVLKSIRNLCANCPEEFNARNFAAVDYTDEKGETRIMFILYRDGFMLLVMGYTGKKAMQIKIAYIEAFNQMEAQVLGKLAGEKALPATTTPSTADDRKPLRTLVGTWSRLCGTRHEDLWPQVRANFQLERIDHLPVEWIPDAIAWVQGRIDALAKLAAKEEQKALPMPVKAVATLTAKQEKIIADANARLEALRSHIDAEVHEVHVDLLSLIDYAKVGSKPWHAISAFIYSAASRSVTCPLPISMCGPASMMRELPHLMWRA